MATSVREFFDGLESRVDPGKTAGMNNSFLFDIDGAGQWTVVVTDGNVSVAEGPGDADVTITGSEETFRRIVGGEQNATTAYMTGKIKIKGDIAAALKLQKLF
jgi:putative sterol carrier protein